MILFFDDTYWPYELLALLLLLSIGVIVYKRRK